jgi:outer membrane protein assembly factor BamB
MRRYIITLLAAALAALVLGSCGSAGAGGSGGGGSDAGGSEVTELAAMDRGLDWIKLTWSDPVSDSLQSVEVASASAGSSANAIPAGTESYVIEGLSENTEYTFSVVATYADGSRSEGVEISAETGAPGKLKWRYDPPGYLRSSSRPAISSDGTIHIDGDEYINDQNKGMMIALHPNGEEKWLYTASSNVASVDVTMKGVSVGPDGTSYYSMDAKEDASSAVFALDSDGNERWNYATAERIKHAVSIRLSSDPVLLAFNTDTYLYWLTKNGSLSHSVNNRLADDNSRPHLMSDGRLVLGDYQYFVPETTYDQAVGSNPAIDGTRYIYTENLWQNGISRLDVDITGGGPVWHNNTVSITDPVIGNDGTIYGWEYVFNSFHAVNHTDGSVRWTADLGVTDSPYGPVAGAVVGSNGTIYVPTNSGVVALDPNGNEIWRTDDLFPEVTAENTAVSHAVMGPRGTVYVVYMSTASGESTLVALFTGSDGPSDTSPWPMVGGDMGNSAHG